MGVNQIAVLVALSLGQHLMPEPTAKLSVRLANQIRVVVHVWSD
jgi:hypothetical protein